MRRACFIRHLNLISFLMTDGGFGPPAVNRVLMYVEPRTGVPVCCVMLFFVAIVSFETAVLTSSWYTAVVAEGAIVSNGFLLVYGMPPLLRILNRHIYKPAKEFDLGRMSIPCAFIGCLYSAFSVATSACRRSSLKSFQLSCPDARSRSRAAQLPARQPHDAELRASRAGRRHRVCLPHVCVCDALAGNKSVARRARRSLPCSQVTSSVLG